MKKIVTIILVFFGLMINAQSNKSLFQQANQLYQKGQYPKAILMYQKIEKSGMQSDVLYFNLGNSFYKLNQAAASIYYYEKALKLNPLNEDAKNNLVYANRLAIDVIDEMPKSFFQKIEANFLLKYNVETWAITAIVFSVFTALLFLVYYFSYSTFVKRTFFTLSIATFTLMILSLLVAVKDFNYDSNNQPAIVFSQAVTIKNAPTFDSENVFVLHEGTKVDVLDEVDDWYKIKLIDGKIGWVKKRALKII